MQKKTFFQKKKSPSISRSIPDQYQGVLDVLQKGSKILFIGIFGFVMFVSISGSIIRAYADYQKQQAVLQERQKLLQDVTHWEGVVEKYKGYRDGYFQLAVLEYKLGDRGKATMYLQKALELDPNFEAGKKLDKLLR